MALETVFIALDQTWTLISNAGAGRFKAEVLEGVTALFAIGASAPPADQALGLPATSLSFDSLDAKVWARGAGISASIAVMRVVDAGNPAIAMLAGLTLSAASFPLGSASGTVIGTIAGRIPGTRIEVMPNDGRFAISDDGTTARLVVGLTAASAGTVGVTLTEIGGKAANSPRRTKVQVVCAPVSTAPVNTALPVIQGVMSAGQDLVVDTGAWTNSPDTFYYSWKRNGTNLSVFTPGYTLVAGDENATITCSVIALRGGVAGTQALTVGRKCLPKVRQAFGQGTTPVIVSTVGANRQSSMTRRPLVSRARIYRMRAYIAVFSPILINGAITDTLFTGESAKLAGQIALSRAYTKAVTGIPARDFVFKWGGSNTWTYDNATFSTGAGDDTGVIVSDWLDFGKNPIPADQEMDVWSAISRPVSNANNWLPCNQIMSNYIERYVGTQDFNTDCVADGLAMTQTSIPKSTTSQGGLQNGYMPLMFEIETDLGTECVMLIDGDSIMQGLPYDAIGGTAKDGTVYADGLGTRLMSNGYFAVGCEKLGVNYVNLGRGSDGTKYTRTKANWRYRLGLYAAIPGWTMAIANNGHNDFAAGIATAGRNNSAAVVAGKIYNWSAGIYLCTQSGTTAASATTGGDRVTPIADGTAMMLRLADDTGPGRLAYGSFEGVLAATKMLKAAQPNVPVLRATLVPDNTFPKVPSSITQSGTTVTVSAPAGVTLEGINVGTSIVMAGQSPTGYRGTVAVTSVDRTSSPQKFTYEAVAALGTVTAVGNYSDMGASEAQMPLPADTFSSAPTGGRGIYAAELRNPIASFPIDGVIDPCVYAERGYPTVNGNVWRSNGEPYAWSVEGTHPSGQGADRLAQAVVDGVRAYRAARPLAT